VLIVLTLVIYLIVLTLYSRVITGRGDNDAFFRGSKKSPWYMVAFGMVGASISGVTFVSVPGMVNNIGMTYMQTCLGFIFGYIVVAFVLLPIYYRLNLTTIYSYLNQRLGNGAYKTGASFFLLSKMTGAAVRFYVVCIILQHYVFDGVGIPFPLTVVILVLLIWLYTRNGGIKTLVWTDTLQTFCMFLALCLIIYKVMGELNLDFAGAVEAIAGDERSRWFVFDDAGSKQYFWKQFLSGIFIVIVMTGLDQDMMQKNLTCKTLRDAQKDMCTYGVAFVPANLLFLSLGVLLSMLCTKQGIPLPAGDELLPMFAASGKLGEAVVVFFTIGILAASFSSADSALTAMTTSYCIDMRGSDDDERLRKHVHVIMTVIFAVIILIVKAVGSNSVIDAIYTICSYTYGPLLGLFLYAFFFGKDYPASVSRQDSLLSVSALCIASPLLCYALDLTTSVLWNYRFGYELLMINGAVTFLGLCIIRPEKE
jgi:Na+/proline symporter